MMWEGIGATTFNRVVPGMFDGINRVVLPSTGATGHMWLFSLKSTEIK